MPRINDRPVLVGLMLVAAHAGVAQAENAYNDTDVPHSDTRFLPLDSALADRNLTVIEGDVLTGPKLMQRGIGVGAVGFVWEDGIVPYYIDPSLGPFVVESVKTAIQTWNSVAGVSLTAINPADADSPSDYLHFTPASGCASWVGRQGGAQPVWTGSNCSAGSMMHEIGHALGLEHEHTRPDRDQYITINWENIDAQKVRNFALSDARKQYYGPYDYASIMHYGEYFFSANGAPTIRALNDNAGDIGQRIAPSAGDIAAIAMLYGSDLSLVNSVVQEAGRSEISLIVTNEYLQGANSIDIELTLGTAKLLDNNNHDWLCTTHTQTLKCSKERLGAGAQSKLVLLLDELKTEEDLNPRLYTKTPDNNLANNNAELSPAAAKYVPSDSDNRPYADGLVEASTAGGTGFWMLGILTLLIGRRSLSLAHR